MTLVLCSMSGSQKNRTNQILGRTNRGMVSNNLTVLIKPVLIEDYLYIVFAIDGTHCPQTEVQTKNVELQFLASL